MGIFDGRTDGLLGQAMSRLPAEEREILVAYYGERGASRNGRREAYAAGKGMTVEQLRERAVEIRGKMRGMVETIRGEG